MTDRACKNCYFYSPNKEKGAFDKWDGECRRNPPNNGFPGVNEDFWCGEFRDKRWPRCEPIEITEEKTTWETTQRML